MASLVSIGVDNGLKGAAFAKFDNSHSDYSFLTFCRSGGDLYNQSMIKYRPIMDWLTFVKEQNPEAAFRILIEKPAAGQGRMTNAAAIASTATTLGRIMMVVEEVGLLDSVLVCPAQTWQKHWWPTSGPNKPKEDKPSIAIAQRLYNEPFIPKLCRKPHDGLTDAALMAETISDTVKWESLKADVQKNDRARRKKNRVIKGSTPALPDPIRRLSGDT